MHNAVNRQKVVHYSSLVGVIGLTGAIFITLTWAFEVMPPERPLLVLMAFMWFLAAAVVGGVGVVVGMCQLSAARAFTAGMRAGQQLPTSPVGSVEPSGLRLVE